MPVGTLKNALYGLALPAAGLRCRWRAADGDAVEAALHAAHTVGGCVQRLEKGRLTELHAVGLASLEEERRVTERTIFRTASVAKMVCALLTLRLQTLGRLSVEEDLPAFLGEPVRHPRWPDVPITLGMLLSHTSGLQDSAAYFASFEHPVSAGQLLRDPGAYTEARPGTAFRYSNFGAGLVGCLLEKRFGRSLEALAQEVLFEPLGVEATFDVTKVPPERAADSYRVLPAGRALNLASRIAAARPLEGPDECRSYLLGAGNLYLTAGDLARLTLATWNGADGFLDAESLRCMHTPLLGWPRGHGRLLHGMGLLYLRDEGLCPSGLWGHQGFAYGAVNGVFFDSDGNGFVSLNSGASEARDGHLALVNRALIRALHVGS